LSTFKQNILNPLSEGGGEEYPTCNKTFLRRVKGITKLDRVRNEDVRKELGKYETYVKIKQK
jgi:hypothetical protein